MGRAKLNSHQHSLCLAASMPRSSSVCPDERKMVLLFLCQKSCNTAEQIEGELRKASQSGKSRGWVWGQVPRMSPSHPFAGNLTCPSPGCLRAAGNQSMGLESGVAMPYVLQVSTAYRLGGSEVPLPNTWLLQPAPWPHLDSHVPHNAFTQIHLSS